MAFNATERTTARYTGTLKDENGAVVGGSVLTSATLTLYDNDTKTILNGRSAQNVLNANGVTIDDSGALVWQIAPADNAIVTDGLRIERHTALFTFTWGSGKQLRHELAIAVRNLALVT